MDLCAKQGSQFNGAKSSRTTAQEKSNKVKDIASRAAHDARRAKDKCIDTIKGEDGKKTDE